MKSNYETTLEKSRSAIRAFAKVQSDYRGLKIGDGEYLAGRTTYKAAMAEYDAAFAAEEKNNEACASTALFGDPAES